MRHDIYADEIPIQIKLKKQKLSKDKNLGRVYDIKYNYLTWGIKRKEGWRQSPVVLLSW